MYANVGESFLATQIFPSGGGMKMRASCVGVGGGAPGTRVGVYAQLRMRTPVARAVRSRASCAYLIARGRLAIPGRKITSSTLDPAALPRHASTSWRPTANPTRPG